MAVARIQSPVLGGDDIVQLVEERLKSFASRNEWYETLESYYYGGEGPGPSVKAMTSAGRPQLRDEEFGGTLDKPRRFSSKRLTGVVDDFAALKGRMPISRVEPPSPDEEGQNTSEKLTKYLYSTYELSHMTLQQPTAGHFVSLLGDVVYLLEPGVKSDADKRVVWTVVHPGICYPSFRHGFQRFEMYDLALVEVWTASDIRVQWGINLSDDAPEPDRRVVTYISPFQRTIMVGTDHWKIVRNVEWDLGFCPAQWIYNKPGHQMGQSDIGNALDQQDLLDHALNVWADGIVYMTYRQPWIKGGIGQDGIIIGPGGPPIRLEHDGEVGLLDATGNPASLEKIIGQTVAEMNASTGSSQVRQEGQMHGSIQTGRSIQAAQGPQSTRIEAFHESFSAAWRELNAKTLKMQEKAPALKDWKGDIFGRLKGVAFKEEMSSKDIGGWYRTTVTWESLVGMNPPQKIQVAAEGKNFGLWDTPYAMEMVGVEDPQAMHKRVMSEKQQEMQMQQPQGGGAGQPPGGGRQPGPTPGGALAGPQAAPPTMLMRPPHMAQQQPAALPGGVPMGASRKAVQVALAGVSLKGDVYAVGELAIAGQSKQITLAITDSRDHTRVVEAVKSLGTTRVRHVKKDNLPPEAVKLA